MNSATEFLRQVYARDTTRSSLPPASRREWLFALGLLSAWGAGLAWSITLHAELWEPQPLWSVVMMLCVLSLLSVTGGRFAGEGRISIDFSSMAQVVIAVLLGPVQGAIVLLGAGLFRSWFRGWSIRPVDHVLYHVWLLITLVTITNVWSVLTSIVSIPVPVAVVVVWLAIDGITSAMLALYFAVIKEPVADALRQTFEDPLGTFDASIVVATMTVACFHYPLLLVGAISTSLYECSVVWKEQQLKQTKHELARDALTGLFNRRALDAHLETMKTQGVGAVIICDIDNFKLLNDSLGHVEGDRALQSVAHALSTLDEQYFVARYGGEEMVVAVPQVDVRAATLIADRVLAAARAGLASWNTSMSMGVAVFDGDESTKEWIDRADKALYLSKHRGKDQIHVSLGREGQIIAAESFAQAQRGRLTFDVDKSDDDLGMAA